MSDLSAIRKRCDAATRGPWRSMRQGNQYIETNYMPTCKCVGASVVEGIKRPWKPYAAIRFGIKAEQHEEARFKDKDADFIAHAREDIPELLDEVERLRALLRESLREHEEDHDPGWACRIEMSGECDCGASKWNAKVNKLLKG